MTPLSVSAPVFRGAKLCLVSIRNPGVPPSPALEVKEVPPAGPPGSDGALVGLRSLWEFGPVPFLWKNCRLLLF